MTRKEKMLELGYKAVVDFITANGKKSGSSWYWEKHPICFRDKCVDGMAVLPLNEQLKIVPYNIENKERYNPFTDSSLNPEHDLLSLRPQRTVEHKHLEGLLQDLEKYT